VQIGRSGLLRPIPQTAIRHVQNIYCAANTDSKVTVMVPAAFIAADLTGS